MPGSIRSLWGPRIWSGASPRQIGPSRRTFSGPEDLEICEAVTASRPRRTADRLVTPWAPLTTNCLPDGFNSGQRDGIDDLRHRATGGVLEHPGITLALDGVAVAGGKVDRVFLGRGFDFRQHLIDRARMHRLRKGDQTDRQ